MIKNMSMGDILALGIYYNLNVDNRNIDDVYDAFGVLTTGHVTGKSVMRGIRNHDAYSAIVYKETGEQTIFVEDITRFRYDGDTMLSRSALLPKQTSTKVSVESYVDQKHSWLSYLNIRVSTIDGAFPKLDMIDDTSTWKQVETKYEHWGTIINRVDERGEVALLTRNIVIEGEVEDNCVQSNGNCNKYKSDTFGGHFKVKDNVCYDTKGHAFFIEDGGEHDTTFDGNLAASVRKGSLIPSDQKPACFWITSPLTKMRNNVAAGGAGHGIWFIYPVEPIGPSKGLGFFKPHEADRTPISEFDNNVVHSQGLTGLFVDHRLMPDGSADQNNAYLPKENPLDEKSKDVEVKLFRLTAYKNVIQNAWLRGGWFHITQSSFADSQKSLQYARHAPLQGFVFYDGPVYGENIWFDGFISTKLYTARALCYDRLNVSSSSSVSNIRNAQFGFVDGGIKWVYKEIIQMYNGEYCIKNLRGDQLDGVGDHMNLQQKTLYKAYKRG
ncbi:cell surface hyaluronidase-like [Ruditapes philippinarum]|uniref:cell surface hyaluronidase-like n=1 Tax=Ruditapes philippinarum TaxID=129788 RepID=UPI00295AC235|nr:cell surface hyaluronidase-like [Ruditapes philippinarum]